MNSRLDWDAFADWEIELLNAQTPEGKELFEITRAVQTTALKVQNE